MDPEASVSALVFHHPDRAYFSVGDSQMPPMTNHTFLFRDESEYGANL